MDQLVQREALHGERDVRLAVTVEVSGRQAFEAQAAGIGGAAPGPLRGFEDDLFHRRLLRS